MARNGFKHLSREKGPVKKDDVDFMGIKREKILDFSPMRGKMAGETSRQSARSEIGRRSEGPVEIEGRKNMPVSG
jgi:hypothetical protein